MPTPSEQKALVFLVFVVLLGGAVRILRAGPPAAPTEFEQLSLARQADAAESAGARVKPKKGRTVRMKSLSGRDSVAIPLDPFAGIPVADRRRDRTGGAVSVFDPRAGWINGYPPPSPRIDVEGRQGQSGGGAAVALPGRRPGAARRADSLTVDLDVATAAELDALPRVGPAMAARIVANRDSFGPFGSLAGLRRVKGMGPATLERLSPRVTFSGRAASFTAGNRRR